jgi:hypothetical protein
MRRLRWKQRHELRLRNGRCGEARHREAADRANAELKPQVEAEEQKARKEAEARVLEAEENSEARIEAKEKRAWLEAEARIRLAEETAKMKAQALKHDSRRRGSRSTWYQSTYSPTACQSFYYPKTFALQETSW